MFGTIATIAWIIFIWDILALIGCFGIAKFMFGTGLIWLRAITDPDGTAKSVKRTAGDAVRYAMWALGSAVVLALLYL